MILMILALSGFVVAVSSKTSTNFNIVEDATGEGNSASSGTFWSIYGGHIVGVAIVLVIIIVFLKRRNPKRKTRKKK